MVPRRSVRSLILSVLILGIFTVSNGYTDEYRRGLVFQLEKRVSLNQKASAYVLGDVAGILNGTVTRESLVRVRLSDIALSLGAGSFSDEREVGDMMVVGGKAYVKSTNPFRSFRTESQSHLLFSPFSIGLKQGELPDAIYRVRCVGTSSSGESPCSVSALYEELSAAYPKGFAVLGLGGFGYLKGSALKAAPIQGEKITAANAAKYMHPSDVLRDKKAVFFGVVVGAENDPEFSAELLSRAFYQNPADTGGSLLKSHSHFIVSDLVGELPAPTTADEFLTRAKAAKLTECRHLLTQSKLQEAVLLVYDLKSLESYQDKRAA